MNYTFSLSAFTACAVLTLAGCGPETNSRYGDEYWDPQATWEAAQVIDQPDLNVFYDDLDDEGTDPDGLTWEAYVEIDFSDLLLRNEGGSNFGLLQYSVGTSEKLPLDPFLQNGKTFSEADFIYDSTNTIDYRLQLTDPENYTFYLDMSVRQPNGTLRIYNFIWNDIILPGELDRDTYWDNRINGLVVDTCVGCHSGGNADAQAAFDIDNTSNTTRMNSYVNMALAPTAGRELPGWILDNEHPGSGTAADLTAAELANITTFTNAMITEAANNNIIIDTVAQPATMTPDPYNP